MNLIWLHYILCESKRLLNYKVEHWELFEPFGLRVTTSETSLAGNLPFTKLKPLAIFLIINSFHFLIQLLKLLLAPLIILIYLHFCLSTRLGFQDCVEVWNILLYFNYILSVVVRRGGAARGLRLADWHNWFVIFLQIDLLGLKYILGIHQVRCLRWQRQRHFPIGIQRWHWNLVPKCV